MRAVGRGSGMPSPSIARTLPLQRVVEVAELSSHSRCNRLLAKLISRVVNVVVGDASGSNMMAAMHGEPPHDRRDAPETTAELPK